MRGVEVLVREVEVLRGDGGVSVTQLVSSSTVLQTPALSPSGLHEMWSKPQGGGAGEGEYSIFLGAIIRVSFVQIQIAIASIFDSDASMMKLTFISNSVLLCNH